MTRLSLKVSMLVAALALSATTALASPITYQVSRSILTGSVVGSITTDGTIGTLTTANIVNWSLTLNDGSTPFTLLGPTSGNNSGLLVSGSSVRPVLRLFERHRRLRALPESQHRVLDQLLVS